MTSLLSLTAQVNTDMMIQAGQNALYFGDFTLAVQYFNRAIESKPYLAKPYYYRATAKYRLNDLVGAENDADQALTLHPYLVDAYEIRGDARRSRENYKAAVADYDAALALKPGTKNLLFKKAATLTAQNDLPSALQTYDTVIDYYPGSFDGYLGRAQIELDSGAIQSAYDDLNRAITLNPNAVDAYVLLAELFVNARNDYSSALVNLNRAIRLRPKDSDLYANRAFVRYMLADLAAARSDNDYALALDSTNTIAKNNGHIFSRPFSSKAASGLAYISHDRDLLAPLPNKHSRDNSPTFDLLPPFILSFYITEDNLEVNNNYHIPEVDKINQSLVLNYPLYITNNEVHLSDSIDIQRHFNSINGYNRQFADNPPHAIDLFGQAMDHFSIYDYDGAVACFTSSIELAPDFALAYFMRAVSKQRSLQIHSAAQSEQSPLDSRAEIYSIIDDYTVATTLSPQSPLPYYNKGNMLVQINDLSSAIHQYDLAISHNPAFGEAYYNRAIVRYRTGDLSQAMHDLSAAARLGIIPAATLLDQLSSSPTLNY